MIVSTHNPNPFVVKIEISIQPLSHWWWSEVKWSEVTWRSICQSCLPSRHHHHSVGGFDDYLSLNLVKAASMTQASARDAGVSDSEPRNYLHYTFYFLFQATNVCTNYVKWLMLNFSKTRMILFVMAININKRRKDRQDSLVQLQWRKEEIKKN